jgi:phenylpropionate dioxygenase-like ring-hydroxylating dioxygenase large terminal subunit
MFLTNYWYVAASSEELTDNLVGRKICGTPVVLYRTRAGSPVALLDACPHRSLPLSMGKRVSDEIQCGYHGLRFDSAGFCKHIPGQAHIPDRARVATFPVVERWRWIWVWMGDPKLADASLIPDMHWNDDPAWAPTGGSLTIECHYQLLVDNLMDLSHAAFVHPGTIGDTSVAETPPKTWVEGSEVFLERHVLKVSPPPFFKSLHGYAGIINRMHRTVFAPPANIVILSRCVAADEDLETSPNGLEYIVLNAITPATETSCHHFWAVNRNFAIEDTAMTKAFYEQSLRTFVEDIAILESQQQRIQDLGGAPDWLNVGNDAAGVHARLVIGSIEKGLRT